jgi:hypothetical protein
MVPPASAIGVGGKVAIHLKADCITFPDQRALNRWRCWHLSQRYIVELEAIERVAKQHPVDWIVVENVGLRDASQEHPEFSRQLGRLPSVVAALERGIDDVSYKRRRVSW